MRSDCMSLPPRRAQQAMETGSSGVGCGLNMMNAPTPPPPGGDTIHFPVFSRVLAQGEKKASCKINKKGDLTQNANLLGV